MIKEGKRKKEKRETKMKINMKRVGHTIGRRLSFRGPITGAAFFLAWSNSRRF